MSQQPILKRKSFWRRIITPRLIFLFGLIVLAVTVVFAYYYIIFSEMIDSKLRGNIYVRATGIYTAPLILKDGQPYKQKDLIDYLQRLGYVADARDSNRGRFSVKGNAVEIEPSPDSRIDGRYLFPRLKIKYNNDGNRIASINDSAANKEVNACLIEPELLTAVNSAKEKRKIVEYKDLPDHLIKAIIAIEDRRFKDHSGIDFRGIFRAIWRNVEEGNVQQGGSTITQQLVKNFFLTPERTLKRKLSEAYISVLLETRLTKEEIFQLYCNEIYLGQDGSYSINGVGEASNFYFDKDVINLNLSEAAFLAGVIRGPGYYSPYSHKDRTIDRRNQVLDAMVSENYIDPKIAEETKKTDLKIRSKAYSSNAEAPYFLDYVQSKVSETLGDKNLSQESYRIYTSIDMDLQRSADRAVRDGLAQIEKDYAKRIKPGSLQAALVALNANTGEILAMVGGRDYSQSQLNRVTDAHRQPGSVFKPIVYTAALNTAYEENEPDKIITSASRFLDAKETFSYGEGKTYEPDNFGMDYSNELVTARRALTKSLNVVTVRVAEKTGYWRVARMAERLGLPKPQPFPALALGTAEATPLEMARAYTTFPNMGTRFEPFGISRITDSNGQTIHEGSPKSQQAISPQVSFIITSILQDVINHGTAARSRTLGFNALAAGKTGTSRDGWFAGFTPNMVCVVYVGFDDNSQLGLEGSKSALPIWTEFMKRALARRPDLGGDQFPEPKTGITRLTLDRRTGLIATDGCSDETYEEYFISGTEITGTCQEGDGTILLNGREVFPIYDEVESRNRDDDGEPPPKNDGNSRPRRAGVFKRLWEKMKDKN